MKLKKLDTAGFSHTVIALLVVVVVGVAGVGYLVASHADSVVPSGTWSYLGTVNLPQQNETVKAYGCKYSVASNIWQVDGFFSLSNSYKVAGDWQASINNTGPTPYPGYATAVGTFSDTTSPSVLVTTKVHSTVNNYLQFNYSDGPSIKGQTNITGTIASNVRPGNLPTCTK